MEIKNERITSITLKDSDADNLKSAIKKIVENEKAIGFKKPNLSNDEMKLLKSLNEKI